MMSMTRRKKREMKVTKTLSISNKLWEWRFNIWLMSKTALWFKKMLRSFVLRKASKTSTSRCNSSYESQLILKSSVQSWYRLTEVDLQPNSTLPKLHHLLDVKKNCKIIFCHQRSQASVASQVSLHSLLHPETQGISHPWNPEKRWRQHNQLQDQLTNRWNRTAIVCQLRPEDVMPCREQNQLLKPLEMQCKRRFRKKWLKRERMLQLMNKAKRVKITLMDSNELSLLNKL